MANSYLKDVRSSSWNSGLSTAVSWAGTGAAIGGIFGGVGAGVGAALGAIFGGLMGLFTRGSKRREYEGLMNEAITNRSEIVDSRNTLITNAQQTIDLTRSTFDEKYGTGMYDQYSELFNTIFGMNGSQTVVDLLEDLSLDTVEGKINSSVLGVNVTSGVLSASDINSAYLEYMMNSIKDADTQIGLQYQMASYQENSLIRDYYDSVDQYNAQIANQFASAFLQQRETNLQLESQIGEAETAQASSGIRQMGGGRNSTVIAEFQKDLSDVAYASSMQYMVNQYKTQMSTAGQNLIDQVYQSRNELASFDKQVISDFIGTMNEHYLNLNNTFYEGIKDSEEAINEYNDLIEDYSEAAGKEHSAHYQEIDDFDD